MRKRKSTPEQKRRRLLYCVMVVAALFIIRIILLRNGRIAGNQALSEEELTDIFRQSQVLVQAGDVSARGTLLQVQEPSGINRKDKATTYYYLTSYEAAAAAKTAEAAVPEGQSDADSADPASSDPDSAGAVGSTADAGGSTGGGLDGSCIITDSNGTSAKAAYVSADESSGIGVVSVSSVDYQPGDFTPDSVYFSENTLYQLKEGDLLYYQAGDKGATDLQAAPTPGSFVSRSMAVDGYEGDRMVFQTNETEDPAPGSGVFSDTGYFLGMVSGGNTAADGKGTEVICVAGNTAVDYFRTNH